MRLIKTYCILFCVLSPVFAQTQVNKTNKQNDQVEEYLYTILDEFLENPSITSLNKLESQELALWRAPEHKEELLAWVVLLCNKGFYQNKFGKATKAIETYEKAWSTYQNNALSGYDIIEYCLKPLGNLYTVMGDYKNAENTIKSYLFIAEGESNNNQKASAIINLSVVYQNTGRFKEAIGVLSQIFKLNIPDDELKAKALSNIITNHISLKAYDKASYYLNELNKINIQNKDLQINKLKLFAILAAISKNYEDAEMYLKKIEQISYNNDFIPRSLSKLYIEYATLLKEQNKLDEAIVILEKAISNLLPDFNSKEIIEEVLYTETAFIDAFDLMASVYKLKNDNETALRYYKLSFKVEDLLEKLYQFEETKLFQINDNRLRSEKFIELCLQLYQKTNQQKYIDDAFRMAEKTKAKVLKETIVKKQKQRLSQHDTLIRNQIEFEKQLALNKNKLIKEQLKGSRANLSVIKQCIEIESSLNQKLKAVNKKINEKYPNQLSPNDSLDLNKLTKRLAKDNALMIEYFYGKNNLYFFTVNNENITLSSIEDINSVNTTVKDFITFFDSASKISNDYIGYNTSAFNLYNLLEIDSFKKEEKLIIVPDGLLNFVPFETLLTEPTQNSNFEALPYLIKEYHIAYNTSAEFYMSNSKGEASNANVLGLFPVFENSKQPLNYSIQEAAVIKSFFSGSYLMNKNATWENFTNQIHDYPILHLSTHASSGNFEVPGSISFYDKTISIYELYPLNVNPELVVLSACETGVGKLQKGEGSMSIARAFQYSGANNLLFSLWKVNDLSTSQFMSVFYEKYKNNSAFYKAAHKAKLSYLKDQSIDNSKKTPYYWGSFVFYGSIESKPAAYNIYLYLAVLLIIVLFFLLKLKNDKS